MERRITATIFGVIAGILFALAATAFPAGQTAESEVHIVPRTRAEEKQKDARSRPAVDPAFKTYTKPMKVVVDLVLVPVSVSDPMDRLVTGLEKENFRVFDGNRLQEIQHFSCEDVPISLGVIFDMSGSMANKIEKAREAVVEFLKTANLQDEFFIIAFNDRPELLADFTRSIENIQGKLLYTIPRQRTALLDAVYLSIDKMREAQYEKKALLIISDGGDNHSRYTDSEIKSVVKEADVQIYAIGIFEPHPPTPEEVRGPHLLAEITDITGGRTFVINNPNELADVASKIGIELRNQYVLGYRPANSARDGRWHKIKVKLQPPRGLPPLTVHAKSGYYAPSE